MIIDCISDLHGHYPKLEGGDLLIIAGDLTAKHTEPEFFDCFDWIHEQDYRKKIVIAGNHDTLMQKEQYKGPIGTVKDAFAYLCDSGTEFEGLKIWGSPWSLWFKGIHPKCKAFTGSEKHLAKKFALIPEDTDILITHSPPFTIRDTNVSGSQVGSVSLISQHISRLRPQLWVFGHIHESYGEEGPYRWNGTKYVNASHVNHMYEPVNKPIRVVLDKKKQS